jgi:D-sedoheptulose 7-phosphate isomerase
MRISKMGFASILNEHQHCVAGLSELAEAIEAVGMLLAQTLRSGGKILICGNGGSAADAQHFAAELIGRFELERAAWPAIALTTDTSILSAIGNDYGFADVFSRQVQGLAQKGDALIGISTSGHSENIARAVELAASRGLATVGLLGRDGGPLASRVDHALVVAHNRTARIQEAHILILHYWAMFIEDQLTRSI